jgi:hypothetical protein
LKRFHTVMFLLVANVGSNVLNLRLAHREGPESRLPEEVCELLTLLTKPVVRTFLEVTDNIAQRLGPGKQKQQVRVVWLGVDLDRGAAQAFEDTAHVRVEIRVDLVRYGSLAVLRREDEMDVDFGEGLSHGVGDSSTYRSALSSQVLAALQAARVCGLCPRASAYGLSPGLGSAGPLGRLEG